MRKLVVFLLFFILSPLNTIDNNEIVVVPSDGTSITVKGFISKDSYNYLYGFERMIETNEVNGVFIKMDKNTKEVIFKIVYDIGYNEVFSYMGLFSDNTFGIINQNTLTYNPYQMDEFISTEIIKFNEDGFLQKKIILKESFLSYGNVNYKMILVDFHGLKTYYNELLEEETSLFEHQTYQNLECQYQGSATINNIPSEFVNLDSPGNYDVLIREGQFQIEFRIIVSPTIFGLTDDEFYLDTVYLESNGEMYLNDNLIVSGTEVYEPGIYHLKIIGENDYEFERSFILKVAYEGITNGEQTTEGVLITSNASRITLNNEVYLNELITFPQEYEVTFYGVNEYKETIRFVIFPKIEGVENYQESIEGLIISVNGEAYLNGIKMEEITEVVTPGSYQIELYFNDNIYQELFFTILPTQTIIPNTVQEESSNVLYNIVLGSLIFIGLVLILRKK